MIVAASEFFDRRTLGIKRQPNANIAATHFNRLGRILCKGAISVPYGFRAWLTSFIPVRILRWAGIRVGG